MTSLRTALIVLSSTALSAAVSPAAFGQSALERTPNVTGGWIGGPHSLHFNFLHRFNNSGEPLRQVTNRPTFLLAYGAPIGVLIGAQYATRSDVAERMPNEWEAFARYGLLGEDRGQPLDVTAQAAYNHAADSWDGELSVARRLGPVRLLGAARVLSSAFGEDRRFALAGGATLRVHQWLALAGDYGRLTDATDEEEAAWGMALQIGIPLTPHSLSIQRTNTNSGTLQGASRGGSEPRWGFEFTVPVALRRYFGRRETVAAAADAPADMPAALPDSARVAALTDSITRELQRSYEQRRLEDSVRFTLRDDSARMTRELAALRSAAREDSARVAAQDSARQAAPPPAQQQRPPTQQQAPAPVRANIRNMAFAPATITIDVGTTVTWRNSDQVVHTVTAKNGSFNSGNIRPGQTWSRTFTRAGRFEYLCTPHPFMTAVVIVRAP